jgi:hypothetical protein
MITHPDLDPHAVIAWDMDETLVNGPNSAFFRAYILAHPEKTHIIVTFRTPRAWAEESLDELEVHGVPRDRIAAVHNVADEVYWAFSTRTRGGDPEKAASYLTYKAITAKAHGATILVDDKHEHVADGCATHGVTFLHALGEFPVLT